jgi:DNA-binding NarL/FixJ family response regulator
MPFESARARVALARNLRASGRSADADVELEAARATLASVGSTLDPATMDAPLASPTTAADRELTVREVEILRLVADGLNDNEIAKRLVLSPHTVHRHVANIRTKLRQPSRAAAAVHAAREGLI